jgi:rhodanese-related sulfurtransferase
MIPRRLGAALTIAALALPALVRADEPFQLVTAEQVEKMLGARDVKVYDVNIDELWEKYHLPGALHVGARALESILPSDKGTRLVFYCSGPK